MHLKCIIFIGCLYLACNVNSVLGEDEIPEELDFENYKVRTTRFTR
jgi:hypothetical protein